MTGTAPSPDQSPRGPLVAILSGAGISTDSGIPDYRGPEGLWRRDPEAEKLVTYDYYMADPEIRRRSWQMRRTSPTWRAEPNAAHRAVAALERAGAPVRVITQNVDGLHQLAGHARPQGVRTARHGTDGASAPAARPVPDGGGAGQGRGGRGRTRLPWLRRDPEVGDGDVRAAAGPGGAGQAMAIAKACEVFIAVGTTLQVQPAASLAGIAAEHGARLSS